MSKSRVDYRPTDQRMWESELADFLPMRIFDAHTHYFRKKHLPQGNPEREKRLEEDLAVYECWGETIFPGREAHYFMLPSPFPGTDTGAHNAGLAEEVAKDPQSRAAMFVIPSMSPDHVAEVVKKHGFIGLKPYRLNSATGDVVDCSITDFLPESQIEVADEMGLWVVLHLSKRAGCADAENLADLERLTKKYPNVRWQLAHCARSFAFWMIEKAIDRLRDMPNIYYDLSAVTDVMSFYTLFKLERLDRIFWGSDGIYVGCMHGKYITYAYAWSCLSDENLSMLELGHCDSEPALVVYEQIRAIRQAADMVGLSRDDVEDIFQRNAARLIASLR